MTSLPAIPEAYEAKFAQMWQSACRVCDHILAYQPDLVVALMHSGWGPVFAAQILWQCTQSAPFPPVARTNIGREKVSVFEDQVVLPFTEFFIGEYSTSIQGGTLLAWIASRTDWHDQLRQQVAEAMGPEGVPQRILVVDDTVHEGSTSIFAHAILRCAYPKTQVRLIDSRSWSRSQYYDFMLDVLCSRDALFPGGKIPSLELWSALAAAALGTEDVAKDSLLWQPFSKDSSAMQALSAYAPPDFWIEFSSQIYAIIEQFIRQAASTYQPGVAETKDVYCGLSYDWFVMRDIWLEGGVTSQEVVRRYPSYSLQDAKEMLQRRVKTSDLVVEGRGRSARYIIPPLLRQYVEQTHAEVEVIPLDAYWLLPNQLMFGSCLSSPGTAESLEWLRKELDYLLEAGIDCWLHVQAIVKGGEPQEPPRFLDESRWFERPAITQVIRLPLKKCRVEQGFTFVQERRATRQEICQILDQIESYLANGRVVYVSASNEQDLRGMLAGCYLARHGQTGAAALRALQACRANAKYGWEREPSKEAARRYVRKWPKGV